MKIKYCTFLFLFAVLSFSCDDDKPEDNIDFTDMTAVTGLKFFDIDGNAVGKFSEANENVGEIRIYPNPSTGIINVSSLESIDKIWLIPAVCLVDSITNDIPSQSLNLSYTSSELDDAKLRFIDASEFEDNFNLNLETVPVGLYRLFFETKDQDLRWINIYVDPTLDNIDNFFFLEELCGM